MRRTTIDMVTLKHMHRNHNSVSESLYFLPAESTTRSDQNHPSCGGWCHLVEDGGTISADQ